MKIWIDFSNSPHVPFFSGLVRELRGNHEFVLTCRPLANTIQLLEIEKFEHTVVGKHYGRSAIRKGLGFPVRIWQLYSHLRKKRPDVAISHSSFHSPLVARLLGIPSIYLNDNEHASANRVAFPFATRILIPEFLDPSKVRVRSEKVVQYPGVKEGVYLWRYDTPAQRSSDRDKCVVVRPEPDTALYYSARTYFLDELLLELTKHARVLLLPRSARQAEHYRQEEFAGVDVAERSIPMATIMDRCDLFIGAGGTMTREAAVLGIPTISVYQDELLDVDRHLVSEGCMIHDTNPQPAAVIEMLNSSRRAERRTEILDKGRRASELIRDTLLELGSAS